MAPISPEDGVVAVTGVSGFTGGWVVQELVNAGCVAWHCALHGRHCLLPECALLLRVRAARPMWLAGLAVLVANWLTGGRAGRHAAALVSVLSFA
jgi:nucleoside-diphosphate-sugar epimerase